MTAQTVVPSADRIRLLCEKKGQVVPDDLDSMTVEQLAREDARLRDLPRLSAPTPDQIADAFGVNGDSGWISPADR